MSATATHEELAQLRTVLADFIGPGLDELEVESAVELESLVLGLLPPFASPEAPPEAARLLPAVLAERGDELAAGLLAAVAAYGSPEAAAEADSGRTALARAGVVSPFATEIGEARAVEAYRLREDGGELFAVVITRTDGTSAHPATVMLEHGPCGGVVADVLVGEPGDPDEARSLLTAPHDGIALEPTTLEEVGVRLRSALEHMVEHDVPLAAQAAERLPFVLRALSGSVGDWPRPSVVPPPDADDPDALAAAFAEHLEASGADPALLEHGPFVAHQLLTWKGEDFERWTSRDLRAFLLDWYPRWGDSDDETIAAVPPSLIAFFAFLEEEGVLDMPAATLGSAIRRLAPEFERRCRDPRRWGPAKALVSQMRSEGVDPTDEESVDAWMADFNARPREERDRILGPAPERSDTSRRRKRHAASQSRKRNRRH